jgi:nucleotide-binding universal stress UspA family protein
MRAAFPPHRDHAMTNSAESAPCVVVGYDGSEPSREAVRYAIRRAGPSGRIVVVYAFELPPSFLGTPYYERHLEKHELHGRAVLYEILRSDEPEFAGVSFEDELVGGAPDEKLLEVAKVHNADEIAVGSHGHGGLRARIGSVAHGLLHLADRPVVVIPRGYVEGRRGQPA